MVAIKLEDKNKKSIPSSSTSSLSKDKVNMHGKKQTSVNKCLTVSKYNNYSPIILYYFLISLSYVKINAILYLRPRHAKL